jgi:lipopolysaccharide biosynthesis regulator YciM
MWAVKLSKERQKDECVCECGYKTLKHFERCPKCNSEAYHTTIIFGKKEE